MITYPTGLDLCRVDYVLSVRNDDNSAIADPDVFTYDTSLNTLTI